MCAIALNAAPNELKFALFDRLLNALALAASAENAEALFPPNALMALASAASSAKALALPCIAESPPFLAAVANALKLFAYLEKAAALAAMAEKADGWPASAENADAFPANAENIFESDVSFEKAALLTAIALSADTEAALACEAADSCDAW